MSLQAYHATAPHPAYAGRGADDRRGARSIKTGRDDG